MLFVFLHRLHSDDNELTNDHVLVAFKLQEFVWNLKSHSLISFWCVQFVVVCLRFHR